MFPLSAKSEQKIIAIILLLAVALRIIAALLMPDQSQLLPDAIEYRNSAIYLLKHWYMVNPYQMPLYPLLIAVMGPGIGQLAADIALSVTSVWLVCALARELFSDQAATIFAGAVAACYPPFIFFSIVGLSETLFIALVLAAFLCWYRGNFVGAAIVAVLAVLTRPIFDLFAPALVVLFALIVHRFSFSQTLGRLASYAGIYFLLMMPWWLSNYASHGSFVRLTLGAGTALYAGNNALNHSGGGNLGVDYDLTAFNGITDLVQRDRIIRNAAIDYIIDNPKRFLELAGLKFIRIWRPWPANEGYRSVFTILVALVSFVPVLLFAGIGLFLKRRMLRRLSPILLFGLGYTAVSMIIVGTIRYRLPLEPFLIIFSGATGSYFVRVALTALARRRGRVVA
jgi:4-amino-4-deoxy-L-arabinose transferase-like glycosyltransferase